MFSATVERLGYFHFVRNFSDPIGQLRVAGIII
jgi:hypothetical protein